ncbi:DUF2637 domain-containing protein [Streptomyces sp. NPDC087219]|uniref:DUF2637 domain-containing protein n=1 Tax=Streptomyces sp. NPDC087219 TaxID=3365770 RepID=UPI00381FD2A7
MRPGSLGFAGRGGQRSGLRLGRQAELLLAFRVSWNALSGVARAIGADSTAALFYPIVVDGLMALALIAALVLTGPDRKFALRVLATYTIASLLLNYVHGLVPTLHTDSIEWGRLTDLDYANWALVLLATSLPVGSIYFGSDLVAKVLHLNPESADSPETASAQSADDQAPRSTPDRPESTFEPLPDPAPTEVATAPAARPTEEAEAAPATRPPRPTTVAEPTGTAPRRTTGRAPAAAKTTADRTRTPADLLDGARLLTADWSGDQLTAERLRRELRIGLPRARALRDQLQAERTGQAQPIADDGSKAGPLDGLNEAASPADTA